MFDMPPNDAAADVDAQQVRQRRIGQFLIAGPALFFTLFALHGIFSDLGDVRRERARSAARTAQAVGKVVEVHYRYSYRSRSSFPVGTVAFATADGGEVRLALALEPGEGIGLTTRVYYDPDDPKNNATRNDTYGWADVVWPNVVPSFFAALMVWGFVRISRMGRRERKN